MTVSKSVLADRSAPWRELGRAVAQARERAKLTQPELAEKANISQSHVSLIEQGRRRPTSETLSVLARALNVRYEVLAEPAGYVIKRPGDVSVTMTPAEADDVAQFLNVPAWARKVGLAAARAAKALSPIEVEERRNGVDRRSAEHAEGVRDEQPEE
jgi:transcriptional regulator with XRE-family HTH domain